jgi:putative PIN family toxin of toxin-antitoxin system
MGAAPARPARIVLDANILVSAVIASGRPSGSELGRTVDRALGGDATVITCPRLLAEVERALQSPGLARWVDAEQVPGAMSWIVGGSRIVSDPETIVRVCRDPDDDYLVALARREAAPIVTGDGDLLVLRPSGIAVMTVGELAVALGVGR